LRDEIGAGVFLEHAEVRRVATLELARQIPAGLGGLRSLTG
jgi:hypothetical protein